jgi:hypothetical protein
MTINVPISANRKITIIVTPLDAIALLHHSLTSTGHASAKHPYRFMLRTNNKEGINKFIVAFLRVVVQLNGTWIFPNIGDTMKVVPCARPQLLLLKGYKTVTYGGLVSLY